MVDMLLFGSKLRKYRKERGLTQGELAEMLLVSAQSVSVWESGKGLPDLDHLCELARVLSVSMDVLLSNRPDGGKTFIGIDGGGTKTEFALIDESGKCLNSVITEGSNPNTAGVERAIQVLRRGIDYLRPGEMNAAGIFVGSAGLGRSNQDVIRTALQRAYPNIKIQCENDIYNVIACCSRPDNCIAVICGMGHIVYSSVDGEITRTGGAGHLFSGGGSSYDIGRDAIAVALDSRDGLKPDTLLTRMIEDRLGGNVWGKLHELYRNDVSYIASFAPLVSQAAQQGDRIAREIMERNSRQVASTIRKAWEKAHNRPDCVILSGSLFGAGDDSFYNLVVDALGEQMRVERMLCPPVWGACLRAADLCGAEAPCLERFLESIHTES